MARVRKGSKPWYPVRRGRLQVEPPVLPISPLKGVVSSLGQMPPLAFSGNERCLPPLPQGRAGENVTSLLLRGPPPVPAELGVGQGLPCVLKVPSFRPRSPA